MAVLGSPTAPRSTETRVAKGSFVVAVPKVAPVIIEQADPAPDPWAPAPVGPAYEPPVSGTGMVPNAPKPPASTPAATPASGVSASLMAEPAAAPAGLEGCPCWWRALAIAGWAAFLVVLVVRSRDSK